MTLQKSTLSLLVKILMTSVFLLSGYLFTNCMNSVDNMIEDYNERFAYDDSGDPQLLPGDEGFQESSMLQEKYPVANDASLTIVAPKAKSYKWELYRINKKTIVYSGFEVTSIEKEKIHFPPDISTYVQALSFYLPDILGVYEGTYELRLEVVAAGKTYKDAAMVIVYDPFYDYY